MVQTTETRDVLRKENEYDGLRLTLTAISCRAHEEKSSCLVELQFT